MDKLNIYIHIGYHKTGSTFLQQQIFPKLKINQVIQPDVTYLAESKDYLKDNYISILKKYGFRDNYKKTIISHEVLSGLADGNPKWNKYLIPPTTSISCFLSNSSATKDASTSIPRECSNDITSNIFWFAGSVKYWVLIFSMQVLVARLH